MEAAELAAQNRDKGAPEAARRTRYHLPHRRVASGPCAEGVIAASHLEVDLLQAQEGERGNGFLRKDEETSVVEPQSKPERRWYLGRF